VKYHGLATPVISFSWREDGEFVSWIFDDHLVAEQSKELRRFLLEQQLAQHTTHIRDVLGQSSPAPLSASAPYPAPKHVALYRKYLGCDCSFNQPVSKLAYPRTMLGLTPPMAHGLSFRILQQTCERILTEANNSTGIAAKVYEIVASTPGHCPTMEFVANRLATSVRTLHRQLRAEKSSFTQVSDDVRCSLAKEYLQTTKLSTEDLAELLGFGDAANFRHAFRRWTGTTPTKFRLQSVNPAFI
jgi:AraC-like DNA-binding protein